MSLHLLECGNAVDNMPIANLSRAHDAMLFGIVLPREGNAPVVFFSRAQLAFERGREVGWKITYTRISFFASITRSTLCSDMQAMITPSEYVKWTGRKTLQQRGTAAREARPERTISIL